MKTAMFFEVQDKNIYDLARAYAVKWARSPDKGSEFEQRTAGLRQLPDSELLAMMKKAGYDMFIGYNDGEVCGHFAFQRYGSDLHVFSVATAVSCRKNPLVLLALTREFFKKAREKATRVRLSSGKNESMQTLLGLLERRAEKLELSVDKESCWIELL